MCSSDLGDIAALKRGRQRYTFLLNDDGGILDDLMVARPLDETAQGSLLLVVNAGTKHADFALIGGALRGVATLKPLVNHALIAIQGPDAAGVMAYVARGALALSFMQTAGLDWRGHGLVVSRSGYTGEDGFEILVPAAAAADLWAAFLQYDRVKPIGLGARDSLRLEAGLCLYGHDMDDTIDPVEAGLVWSIGKRRKTEGGFAGADIVQDKLLNGVAKKRVGILPEGRAPAREGTEIAWNGRVIGKVTSGGFGPSLNGPLAMGYVMSEFAENGTRIELMVRGKALAAIVAPMPFVPHGYKRK